LVAVGAVTGLAILAKSFPGLLILVVWGVWALAETKHFPKVLVQGAIALAIASCLSLPWSIYAKINWPAETTWETAYSLRHFSEILEGHDHAWFYYIIQIGRKFTEFVYIAIVCFFIDICRNFTSRRLVLLIWFAAPNLLFSFAATKMPAYVAISWPAIFIIYATYWWRVFDALASYSNSSRMKKVGLRTLLIVALALPIRLSLERIKVHRAGRNRNPAWTQQLRNLDKQLPKDRPIALFNTVRFIEAMFYADVTAYAFIPNEAQLKSLVEKGYHIAIIDNGQLPQHVTRYNMQQTAEQLHGHIQIIPRTE
jgi:4-amino-4-deoxy-L-arabinose transferase